MAKKKPKQPRKWVVKFCENDGGLGIEPCEWSEIATVDFTVSMDFSMRDKRTLHLCDECAKRLKEQAKGMGYDVKID